MPKNPQPRVALVRKPPRNLASLRRLASIIPLRRTALTLACLVFAGVAEGVGAG